MNKVVLENMAKLIKSPFTPLDVFKINETAVRLVKIKGRYHWHKHTNQDELFIVIRGEMDINLTNEVIHLNEGEGCVVKRGVMHQSYAENEALALIFEPQETLAEGD